MNVVRLAKKLAPPVCENQMQEILWPPLGSVGVVQALCRYGHLSLSHDFGGRSKRYLLLDTLDTSVVSERRTRWKYVDALPREKIPSSLPVGSRSKQFPRFIEKIQY